MKRKTRDEKLEHNLNELINNRNDVDRFIYVPVQFGNLSDDLRRVKCVDSTLVKDEDEKVITYKLLEIVHGTGSGRRIIWLHKLMEEDEEQGDLYEFEFMRYRNMKDWSTLKDKDMRIHNSWNN